MMGAPNLVRGGSHSGNVATAELARAGMLDLMSSDYVPSSLLIAALMLPVAAPNYDLPAAIRTVSKTPAEAVGLTDRGEIAAGKRADIIRVHAAPEGSARAQRVERRTPRRIESPCRNYSDPDDSSWWSRPSGGGKDTLIAGAKEACHTNPDVVFPRRVVTRAASAAEDHDSLDDAAFERARGDGALRSGGRRTPDVWNSAQRRERHPRRTHRRVQCLARYRGRRARALCQCLRGAGDRTRGHPSDPAERPLARQRRPA